MSTLPGPKGPSSESLAKLIDAEISYAVSENARSGISPWLLIASLAGLLWAITKEEHGDLSNSLIYAMAFSTAIELLIGIKHWLTPAPTANALIVPRFQTLSRLLECPALCLAATCFQAIALLTTLAVLFTQRKIPILLMLLGVGSYGIVIIGIVVRVVVLKHMDLVLPTRLSRVNHTQSMSTQACIFAVSCAFFGLRLFFLVMALNYAIVSSHLSRLPDARIGGLIAASFAVLQLLAYTFRRNPMIESLLDLRRALVLEPDTADNIASELEVIFLGMTTSSMLQGRLKSLIDAIGKVRESFRTMANELKKFDAMYMDLKEQNAPASEYDALRQAALRLQQLDKQHKLNIEQLIVPAQKRFDMAVVALKLSGDNDAVLAIERRVGAEIEQLLQDKEEYNRGFAMLAKRVGSSSQQPLVSQIESF